ncbi:MAG: hypothetical protein ABSC63_19445 [Candidatus Binataceae bacterium]|jgi:hypothetical protein
MIERRSPGLLLTIVAMCVLAAPLQALAQTERPRSILIRVDSVLAANTGKGMDAQLSSSVIGRHLKDLFEYTTYRLVMQQKRHTRCGRMVVFEMPGGRILHIAPSSVLDNMISMEIVLFEGTRPLMTTDLKLMNHAVLIVAGPRYQQGMLITMISTDAPDRPGTHGVAPEAMPPPRPVPSLPDVGANPVDSTSSPQH